MNKYIVIANSFLGVRGSDAKGMRNHYNAYCMPLVAPKRQYAIQRDDNWCAMFTSVVASLAHLRAGEFPFEVSVGEQVKLAKAAGTWYNDYTKAKEGDLIVFDWKGKGWPTHVGFVKSIEGSKIVTIEGNKNNMVGEREVYLPTLAVMGFIRLP